MDQLTGNESHLEEDHACAGCGLFNDSSSSQILALVPLSTGLAGALGNIGVLVILLSTSSLQPFQHPSNQPLFMLSLGFSDLASALCFLFFNTRYALLGRGPANRWELDIGAGLLYCLLNISLFSTICIGLDKLVHVTKPFAYANYWTPRRCAGFIIGYWLLSPIPAILPSQLAAIPHYFYKFDSGTLTFLTVHDSKVSTLFVWRAVLFLFLVLLFLIGYLGLCIIIRRFTTPPVLLSRESSRPHPPQPPQPHSSGIEKDTCVYSRKALAQRPSVSLKGTKTIGLVIMAFSMLWFPYFVFLLMDAYQVTLAAQDPRARRNELSVCAISRRVKQINGKYYNSESTSVTDTDQDNSLAS
ncbi:unnamed protein product [Dibothriocephalus latus]|uniref:G-protein coupled receptors family 1 profile domain-containing protein n=1 Tax=Dibothriocephalus latus TaxID=60516 RepID=A0A3P6UNK0_DIBLA|nr:unnamed protein product [Dibothriocephalus latus]